jgi:peptide/nickel transport system substrate-binding protein
VPKSVLAHRNRVSGLSLAPTNSYPLADVRLEA